MKHLLTYFLLALSLLANKPNHLLGQTSPYLQQHLYNPVDWYPWSKKAFLKAKKEHKMIFLSIGYSTCHWCHVMEIESFSDKEVAKLLNKYFVSIKVDKEEMPQVDKYYQKLYQKIYKKNGGWPLSVFLTEDLKPFFIGKYIPKYDGYGSVGLIKLLKKFAKIYQNDKAHIKNLADKLMVKEKSNKLSLETEQKNIIKSVFEDIQKNFDKRYKGFGHKAKYPKSSILNFLMDYYKVYHDKNSLDMAMQTLDAMRKSSIYDIISGGFFRYTTDKEWSSPHFEKMLYSNAQILSSYLKAYKILHNKNFKSLIIQSIEEIDKHFQNKLGLYYGASDANSNGMEGGYYVFRYDLLLDKLILKGIKKDNAMNVLNYLDIKPDGNYDSEYALPHLTSVKKPKNFGKIVAIIKNIKEKRDFPFVDKKTITSWNAMMIKTKLKASVINPLYKKEALFSLKNLLKTMQKNDGSLYHQTYDTNKPKQNGLLEDYAYLSDTLLSAYEITLNGKYLQKAESLTNEAIKRFYKNGRWYLDEEKMTVADGDDSYYTAPLSVMMKNILNLATLKSSLHLKHIFVKTTYGFKNEILKHPIRYAQMADNILRYKKRVVVVKSNYKNLVNYKKEIADINYPFLLKEVVDTDNFLSCDIESCFGYGSFDKVKNSILSFRLSPIE